VNDTFTVKYITSCWLFMDVIFCLQCQLHVQILHNTTVTRTSSIEWF